MIAIIVVCVVVGAFLMTCLMFSGALAFGYKRGGFLGMLRMLVALVFHEIMIIFFH